MFGRFRGFRDRLKKRGVHVEQELTLENSNLTPQQVATAKKALKILGLESRNHALSKQDFIVFLYAMGLNPTDDIIDSKIRAFKLHHKKTFTFGQLAHVWYSMLQDLTDEDEILKRAFQFFDKDGNGEISVQELKTTMHELGDLLSEEEIGAFMAIMDVNNDGVIGYTEFLATLKTQAPELAGDNHRLKAPAEAEKGAGLTRTSAHHYAPMALPTSPHDTLVAAAAALSPRVSAPGLVAATAPMPAHGGASASSGAHAAAERAGSGRLGAEASSPRGGEPEPARAATASGSGSASAAAAAASPLASHAAPPRRQASLQASAAPQTAAVQPLRAADSGGSGPPPPLARGASDASSSGSMGAQRQASAEAPSAAPARAHPAAELTPPPMIPPLSRSTSHSRQPEAGPAEPAALHLSPPVGDAAATSSSRPESNGSNRPGSGSRHGSHAAGAAPGGRAAPTPTPSPLAAPGLRAPSSLEAGAASDGSPSPDASPSTAGRTPPQASS